MKPEDIDKLFKDRLAKLERAPSSEAWQRLQEQLQPQPKRKVLPIWWSIAATLAFLLLTGTYLYFNHLPPAASGQLAGASSPTQPAATQGKEIKGSAAGGAETEQPVRPEELVAKTTPAAPEAAEKTSGFSGSLSQPVQILAQPSPRPAERQGASAVSSRQQAPKPLEPITVEEAAPVQLARQESVTQPVQVNLTPAKPAPEAIEVLILKDDTARLLAGAGDDAASAEDGAASSRKGKLVKGLLRQAKNLASGEKIDLSDIGIDRYSIALETQIGNRKISKTINF
jgi:hypothetical protein